MLAITGLSLIVAGWVIQGLRVALRKDRSLSRGFLVLYAAGCAALAAGGFGSGEPAPATLNLVLVLLPLAVLLGIRRYA